MLLLSLLACDPAKTLEETGRPIEESRGLDSDCAPLTLYADADGDGWGDSPEELCEPTEGYVEQSGDCDDQAAEVNPEATELCDGIDNDCDGLADDADQDVTGQSTWYLDADGDGVGDTPVTACDAPDGVSETSGDCDDSDNTTYPGATELCDGVDNDCDGTPDQGLLGSGESCASTSCATVLLDQPGAAGGLYWLDDGSGAREWTCDMSTDGGGWTQVLHWDRENDGEGIAEWKAAFSAEMVNTMTTWAEGSSYIYWCDEDLVGDAMSYEHAVAIPNGGEVLWAVKEDGRDYFYNSAAWFYGISSVGDENLICSETLDEPELYETSTLGWMPSYDCPTYDLDWRWDETGQTQLSDTVVGVGWTSLHHDSNCGDESRMYRIEAWVR